ncbi:MAG: DEAD/DEAH box helicase [Flavobacteriales bacterium]|nr:DEAD/DEAH box helicase [Flavobacteriales bacterium]
MRNSNTRQGGNSSYRGKKRRPSGNAPRNNSRNNSRRQGRKLVSSIDPSTLVQKAISKEEQVYEATRTIEELPIDKRLRSCLASKGFKTPTEIQDRSLDPLLQGRDILGIAQTGTGKTGAFLIPMIDFLLKKNRKEHALIVVPTRELALQVEQEFKSMTKGLGLHSCCFIGGTNINKDLQKLQRPSHIYIGTPGRLLDLIDRRVLDLRNFNTLVLDEFDRMLDMGFARDMDKIIDMMRNRKQTMLFSATIEKSQQRRIDEILHKPVSVKVSSGLVSSDHIDQDVIRLKDGEDKFKHLCELLEKDEFARVLVFDETKHRVKRLCRNLNKQGIKSEDIHGNKSQNARQVALNAFKKGKVDVLVATDVAARGIDVDDVTHVINYQLPMTYDSYIHRIGRTGRAGKGGRALTYVN